jgi:pyruvate/2-oxoacid:ferredoxin oxidoreductase alpha subunit
MHIDGLGDCLRYGIHHLFPMMHDQGTQSQYIDSDDRMYVQPGAEYIDEFEYDQNGLPTKESIIKEMMREVEEEQETWC